MPHFAVFRAGACNQVLKHVNNNVSVVKSGRIYQRRCLMQRWYKKKHTKNSFQRRISITVYNNQQRTGSSEQPGMLGRMKSGRTQGKTKFFILLKFQQPSSLRNISAFIS